MISRILAYATLAYVADEFDDHHRETCLQPQEALLPRLHVLHDTFPKLRALLFPDGTGNLPAHFQHNQLWARMTLGGATCAPEMRLHVYLSAVDSRYDVALILKGTFEMRPFMVRNVVKLGLELPLFFLSTTKIFARDIRLIALMCPRLLELSIFLDQMQNGPRDYLMPVLKALEGDVKEKTGRAMVVRLVGVSLEDSLVSDSESEEGSDGGGVTLR